MKERALILGANGFIGSNLVKKYLSMGYDVFGTLFGNAEKQIPGVDYRHADLTKRYAVEALFSEVRPDIVINAAAVTTGSKDVVERPFLHVTDNAQLNALVFEACHTHKVKHCLFFSCSVMYQPKTAPQSETDWDAGEEIYGAYFGVGNMKVFSEKLCEFYSRLRVCKYTVLRLSNVYGPGDKFDLDKCHMLPALIKKVSDADEVLEIWGSGEACRDLIYIDDVVECAVAAIKKQITPYELFNCGIGHARSISYIANTIKKVAHKETLRLVFDKTKPDIPTTVVLNVNKAMVLLEWGPKIKLEDGIAKTLDYYQSLC